jgi:hypothetical protein
VTLVLLGDQASYHHLEVGDGIEAMLAYQEMLNLNSNGKNNFYWQSFHN